MSSEWTDWNYGGGGYDSNTAQTGFYSGGAMGNDSYNVSYGDTNASFSGYMTPAPVQAHDFGSANDDEFANEPPLLEELGINLEHIVQKTLAVLNPWKATRQDVAGDADLAGPLVFCLAFGALLLLVGKVHFNYIYGIGVMGCLAMYALLWLMSPPNTNVQLAVIISVLGYCILPIVMLSALSIVVSLQGLAGNLCSVAAVGWCAISSSKLFITAFNMEHQQLLVAYPCSLLYAVFALITMF